MFHRDSHGRALKTMVELVRAKDENRFASILKKLGKEQVNAMLPDGGTLLHEACLYGSPAMAELLLDAGADPERAMPGRGYRPLHLAARDGQTATVLVLVSRGADVNAPYSLEDLRGYDECSGTYLYRSFESGTALHCAIINGRLDVAICLVEHGADIDARYRRYGGDAAVHSGTVWNEDLTAVELAKRQGLSALLDVMNRKIAADSR